MTSQELLNPNTNPAKQGILSYWPAMFIGTTWLILFWPMISGDWVSGFRDSSSLYYPLFKWIDAQWAAGEIPLWNPYCNYGMPVVGDGSSSVFYPGKLIFFLRFLSYPSRYGIYLAIHIPIAAAGTYWLAKTFRATKSGATLAACGYAFGGSVLFQVSNVIFLVSAAWLPLAVCCVWKMTKTRKLKWSIGAAVCCALMILGGDPQMVYHVGLIAIGTILFEARRIRQRQKRTQTDSSPTARFLFDSAKLMLAMVFVTTALSAIQLLPTYQWSQRSERSSPLYPANIYQLANTPGNIVENSLPMLATPQGTIDHTYQFSKEYWSGLELIWPNFFGKTFPQNRRWFQLPASDRIWVPSSYMGVLVGLLGLFGLRFWGANRKTVWLSWLFLFFFVASFGWYGASWLYHAFAPQALTIGDEEPFKVGPQVGGLYWLMQILLPKYYVFRYPAKLFVIASLAISILAGRNLRLLSSKHFTHFAFWFTAITIGQFFLVLSICNGGAPSDQLFGQFDQLGATRDLLTSSIQVVLAVSLAIIFARVLSKRSPNRLSPKTNSSSGSKQRWNWHAIGQASIVAVALIDVAFANHWMLAYVHREAFETPVAVQNSIESLQSQKTDSSPVQVFRHRDLFVTDWDTRKPEQRLEQIVRQQREFLYPKHHLEHEVVLLGSFSSVWPEYYERVLKVAENENPLFQSPRQRKSLSETSKDRQVHFDGTLTWGPEIKRSKEQETTSDATDHVIWLDDNETETSPVDITISHFSSNRVVANFETSSKGYLAFGRIAEPGWYANITKMPTEARDSRELTLQRESETLLLAIEEPGEYEVEFRYLPRTFLIGAGVSGVGWIMLLIGLFCPRPRKAEVNASA